MLAAIAGVTFANVLVFIQLGVLGALTGSIGLSYEPFRAHILISSSDMNTLTDGSPISRRYMWQALAVDGVEAAAPVYLGQADWKLPSGAAPSVIVYALPPEAKQFQGELIGGRLSSLTIPQTALIDLRTRKLDKDIIDSVNNQKTYSIEYNGKQIKLIGGLESGGGLSSDGLLIVSESTYLELFPQARSYTPSIILVDVKPGKSIDEMVYKLEKKFTAEPLKIRPIEKAISDDVNYQKTERPIGVIFGFGVFIGLLVGLVIVYQVLSTDVADHLKEYATLKAMGYKHAFFISVILEEAVILAILGFVPGFTLSSMFYFIISKASGMPFAMEASRMFIVFIGTIIACSLSGIMAARRLKLADPAELF
jgi:putative ABC transport system permease protein